MSNKKLLTIALEQLQSESVETIRERCMRRYDSTCRPWTKDPKYNMMFLRHQERYANDLLMARGHLFLNEVYDMLGMSRTMNGQIVGWVWDGNTVGVEFEVIGDMVIFHVDGVILDKIQ